MRILGITLLLLFTLSFSIKEKSNPLFITDIKVTGKGELLMTCKGDKTLRLYDSTGKQLIRSWKLNNTPTGIDLWNNKAVVTCFDKEGQLLIIGLDSENDVTTIKTGSGTTSPIVDKTRNRAYICNQYASSISEIDLANGKLLRSIPVLREPRSIVLSKDRKTLFVANHLPAQRADVDYVASAISVIDIATFKKTKDILLENGSNALGGMCLSPDGKYIFVAHNLGRFTVPTSQLQQGWMNTSAISIVDVNKQEFIASVLVDEPERGAAGTWDVSCTDDKLVVSHSGVHEISVIDYPSFIKKFEAYPDKPNLNYDLRFLYDIRERIPLKGNGPRNFAINGQIAYIPTYFSDDLNIYNLDNKSLSNISLNPDRIETPEEQGERIFNDATYCFQNWQSCNGCHPGDGRMDGLNWDLMNDGLGNSKNCKSLLFSHVTAPSMISGIRENAELAVRKGFYHIQFYEISEEDAKLVDAYLKALQPIPSPLLIDGELSDKAQKGKKIFEQLKCDNCHSGPYYTDMKMHRIGDDIEFEKGWDTPTLREVWRTAPYLFDGRAATMEDVFKEHKHGIDKKLSKSELEELVEYVNSL
ncbi:MAG: YVTN family beta-propeller repeat-containing protein [Dysgonomonas sp.]